MHWSRATLLLSVFLSVAPVYAQETSVAVDSYTINYKTISIIEYLQFASKICKTNFIYDDTDLNFTMTVVSDEPMTPKTVMATLIQVLRIHGLTLLEQGNNLVIHKSQDVKQIAKFVTEGGMEGNSPIVTRLFRTKTVKPDSLAAIIRPMISSSAILETSPETHHLILTDITMNVDKVATLIENLDSPISNFSIKSYEVLHHSPEQLAILANQMMTPLTQGHPFMLVPQDLTHSIFIVSSPDLAQQAMNVLKTLDTPVKKEVLAEQKSREEGFFVYKVQSSSGEAVLKSLQTVVDGFDKKGPAQADLLHTVATARWIPESNSIFFIGPGTSIAKIKEILPSIDTPQPSAATLFVYTPQNRSAKEIEASVLEMIHMLKNSQRIDSKVLATLESMKVNPVTGTLIFSGDSTSFPQVKELLSSVDTGGDVSFSNTQFYIYKPLHLSGEQLSKSLKDVTSHLESDKLADPGFLHALESMKWVKSTSSLIFTGDSLSLKKVEGLVATVDIPSNADRQYYVYKLQYATGDQIEDDLDSLAKGLKSSDAKDAQILKVIDRMRYVKETNSLVLTGDAKALEEVKALIAQYDHPRNGGSKSHFFMYKPQNMEAPQIEKSLRDIASNLRKSELADPQLLQSIDGMKYVDSTHSIVFTGAPEALGKIKALLVDIDIPMAKHSPIQKVGKSTYLLYKLKSANGAQVITALRAIASDLKKSGAQDKEFIATLSSMKYVKETNSIMFTGPEESLLKVQALVEKFDVSSLASPSGPMIGTASNFFVYKPQSLPGPEIEKTMLEFADNLKMSGLSDPELFNAIQSMRWVDKTQTLVFTGTPKALDQVKELLLTFDLPSGALDTQALGQPIQSIDNTSFLVYKLQFHKGDEIQGALKQIAKDIAVSNASISQNLLNAINSIQWLQVTNSLLFSGDQETLTRLKELVKNLDVPLKQVFIEVLVLQTSLSNGLTFGLEWGANYKYKNKFSGNTYNTVGVPQTVNNTTSVANDLFTQNLSKITSSNTPTPQMIPPPIGTFDLGVIGEIIKHNGQSFLSLGSLLTAVQADTETSIVMMPKIITQDGKTSTLFSGSNIPFAGSFVNNTGSNATVLTSNIEYRDIGFNLTITPVLGNSDIITLDIALDSSQVIGDVSGAQISNSQGNQSVNGISTTKTTLQTTVHIPNNHFLILSGMVNDTDTKVKQGIPCLGGLPGVGALFSTSADTIANNNVVIFIRPRLINSLEDMRDISAEQEGSFRDLTGTPFLQHQFDEGMELIKTIDDE